MSNIHTSIEEVERLLRAAGVAAPQHNRRGSPAPSGGPFQRFMRQLRRRAMLLTVCLVLALAGVWQWTSGTATDPIVPPSDPQIVQPPADAGAVDPRFGIVESFRAPRQESTLGVGWERMIFWWKELQKDGPNSWDPFVTDHDREITHELQNGHRIAGLLINTPLWAATNPAAQGASPPKGLYLPYNDPDNYWGHFVSLIARRYAGRIDDWIIWNEVNIPSGHWHTWAGSNADYTQLIKVAFLAARAVNPHARIVLAGDPYWYDHGAFFTDLMRRLTSSSGARAHGDYFDVVNLHLYSRPADMARVVTWYKAAMRSAHVDKPIWISETNAIPYDDPQRRYPRGGFLASLDDQASFIVQALAIDVAEGVQRIEINRMLDGTDFEVGGQPFGLVRNDGSARPAFWAYRAASTLFAGTTGGTFTENSHTGVDTVTLRRPGATISVIWDQRPTPVSVLLPAYGNATVVYNKFGLRKLIAAEKGFYRLQLAPATGNTNTADPADYVIGGSPLIIVQS